jgi:hypothetical protein
MHRLALLASISLAACVPAKQPASSSVAPRPHGTTTESEWQAASDLAATLARAAGGQRLAPALRVSEPGPVVRRHLTLVAGGCYHVGVAWLFGADLEANVAFDTGTAGDHAGEHHLGAPGGALDFCTDTNGGVSLTFRPIPTTGTAAMPSKLDLAVVYGSATKPRVAGR